MENINVTDIPPGFDNLSNITSEQSMNISPKLLAMLSPELISKLTPEILNKISANIENTGGLTGSNNEIPIEIMKEMNTQIEEEIKNIGDVTDITYPIPEFNKLHLLQKLIDNESQEKIIDVMSCLASANNCINPNNNIFSNINKKEIIEIKIKQKKEKYKEENKY